MTDQANTLRLSLEQVGSHVRGGNTTFVLRGTVSRTDGSFPDEVVLPVRAHQCTEDDFDKLALARVGQLLVLQYTEGADMGNTIRRYLSIEAQDQVAGASSIRTA